MGTQEARQGPNRHCPADAQSSLWVMSAQTGAESAMGSARDDASHAALLIRQLRLGSGLVLFAYVSSHLINHSLGLISLAAMEATLRLFQAFWTGILGTILLGGAFATHFGLALWALWQRRTLHMPIAEAVRSALGFAIPLLLARHFLATQLSAWLYGTDLTYTLVVLNLWYMTPAYGFVQVVLLVAAWTHAAIGLRFWLRIRPWYDRWQPVLFAATLLIPTLALLGFLAAAREIRPLAASPVIRDAFLQAVHAPDKAERADIARRQVDLYLLFAVLPGLVLAARALRPAWQRRRGLIRVTYPNGQVVEILRGTTVLEASRLAGIAHVSLCGGQARCSTCRIQIAAGHDALPPPSTLERKVLERVGAPPSVRLACQLRPDRDVSVMPIFATAPQPRERLPHTGYHQGTEREIAIVFVDLRSFTTLAESRFPFDVVFLLNRYFAAMGIAIEESGGQIDKFIGDGVMALFGLDVPAEIACRQALTAARNMSRRLMDLNSALGAELVQPLRIGMGIHVGTVIVGVMGYGQSVSVTAIGDAVNVASRLEGLCKVYDCELVISESVAIQSGIDLSAFPGRKAEIRGHDTGLAVRSIPTARELPAIDAPVERTAALT
jgi:adenylate cyclase